MDETSWMTTTNKNDDGSIESFWNSSIVSITQQTRQFAIDRDWEQYHTPRNLLLALIGELGELAELVQWHGDDDDNERPSARASEQLHDQLAQELADVTIYLMRLADVCQVDLAQEAKRYWFVKETLEEK
jgi:dCTP diphosphatase